MARPGFTTSMRLSVSVGIQHLDERTVGRVGIAQEGVEREAHGPRAQRERARFHGGERRVVFRAVDGLELHDVAGTEEHHEIAQIVETLLRVEDRRGRDAEHLVAARAAHRIDAAEAAAVTHGEFRRVGAWAQVFGHLQLAFALDHLIHERQARDETDHRDEPRRIRMRGDEFVDVALAVDARGVFQIGRFRILMTRAKAHQRFVRPRIVVEHWHFDNACVDVERGLSHFGLDAFQQRHERVGRDHVRVVAHLVRGVRRTDFGYAWNLAAREFARDRRALEERVERHVLADLGEDEFVAAIGVAYRHDASCGFDCLGSAQAARQASIHVSRKLV
ncbi:hypothetical protein PT2222_70084 [Paraburkholderia tropica]